MRLSRTWPYEIESYGIGYGDSPEYDELMKFFVSANDGLFEEFIEYLEP